MKASLHRGFAVSLLIAAVAFIIAGGVYMVWHDMKPGPAGGITPNAPAQKTSTAPITTTPTPVTTSAKETGIPGPASTKSVQTSAVNTKAFTIQGYVVYESPAGGGGCGTLPNGASAGTCPPEYNFLIIGKNNTPIRSIDLSTMAGAPSISDTTYTYLSSTGYNGTLPNIGDYVKASGTVDASVKLNPPTSFPMTLTSVQVIR